MGFHLLFWNYEDLKELRHFFLFLTGKEKKAEKKEFTFFVPLVCTVCWLNISCTNCWFFKNVFWGRRGTRKEEKEEKGRNPKKRRILTNIQACLQFQNSQTADRWVHFNFSLITHLCFKPGELITYLCEVPYAMRPFRISSFKHSPRNQQLFFLSFFLFKIFSFILVSSWSLSLPFLPNTQAQGWKMKHISNVKYHFLFLYVEELIMQLQFIRTVNTCI